MVERDILLLERNGEFGELPPEMQGMPFKIEYPVLAPIAFQPGWPI